MSDRSTLKSLVKVVGTCISLFGLVLLVRVFVDLADGSLTRKLFPQLQGSWVAPVVALVLSLPMPFHVISVGFVIQRRWMAAKGAKIVWVATLASGLWLGAALAIKVIFLR